MTSATYQCQKLYVLYDTVVTDEENNLIFINMTAGSSSAFDPDLEAGAISGKTGICVDVDSSYNEGCTNKAIAMVKDGAIGCIDGQIGPLLCGLSLDVCLCVYSNSLPYPCPHTHTHVDIGISSPIPVYTDQTWRHFNGFLFGQHYMAESTD